MNASLARTRVALALVCVSSLGSAAVADDFAPPAYRGQPLSLVARWEFASAPSDPYFIPPDSYAVHPTPGATVDDVAPHGEFAASNWTWIAGDGNGALMATGGPGSSVTIAFKVPNCLPPHALLDLRVQVTYQYPFVGAPGFVITAESEERLFAKNNTLTLVSWPGIAVGGAQPDNQHFYRDFVLQPAWHFDTIAVTIPFATALDEIVIDAVALPAMPVNDACATPTLVHPGLIPFTTLDATPDAAESLPAVCDEGHGKGIIRDVWFVYWAQDTGSAFLTTCDPLTNYDTRLAVYEGFSCGSMQFLACNDDVAGCDVLGIDGFPLLSTVTFDVTCGKLYWIRVGGYPGLKSTGSGSGNLLLSVNGVPCPPCTAVDFDANHQIDGADLAVLLGAWGTIGPGDANGDGIVDAADLAILLGAWGPCP